MPEPYPGVPCILDRNYCKECSKAIVGTAAAHHGEWPVGYYHPLCLINRFQACGLNRTDALIAVRGARRVRFEKGLVY